MNSILDWMSHRKIDALTSAWLLIGVAGIGAYALEASALRGGMLVWGSGEPADLQPPSAAFAEDRMGARASALERGLGGR
jgi:hypothetical protein